MVRLFLGFLFLGVGCAEKEMEDYCDPGPCEEETGLDETGLEETGLEVSEGDAARGADVFAGTCAGCHGADGSGGSAPGLMYLAKQNSDAELTAIIMEGSGGMPPQTLSAQEVVDVIAFLRETYGEFDENGHR